MLLFKNSDVLAKQLPAPEPKLGPLAGHFPWSLLMFSSVVCPGNGLSSPSMTDSICPKENMEARRGPLRGAEWILRGFCWESQFQWPWLTSRARCHLRTSFMCTWHFWWTDQNRTAHAHFGYGQQPAITGAVTWLEPSLPLERWPQEILEFQSKLQGLVSNEWVTGKGIAYFPGITTGISYCKT